MTTTTDICPNCQSEPRIVREQRWVPLGSRRLMIDDEYTHCDTCGEDFYTQEQADLRHRRVVEAARREDNLLSPSRIREVRETLQLTQRQFEDLLGVGEKTCVRWETGRVCQNAATDRLIRVVAAHPEAVATLAAVNGVVLPAKTSIERKQPPDFAKVLVRPDFPTDPVVVVTIGGTPEKQTLSRTEEHEIIAASQPNAKLQHAHLRFGAALARPAGTEC